MSQLSPVEFLKAIRSYDSTVKICDPVAKTMHEAGASTIPWPVIYLITHHRKHVFNDSIPSVNEITKAVNDWRRRVRWRAYFGPETNRSQWECLKSKKQSHSICSESLDPVFEQEVRDVTDSMIMQSRQTINRFKVRQRQHGKYVGNCGPIVAYAYRWLQGCNYIVCRMDKDSSFVLIEKKLMRSAIENARMEPHFDKPQAISSNRVFYDVQGYQTLCGEIARTMEDPELFSALVSDSTTEKAGINLLSKPVFSCKTTKEQGKIGIRTIHTATRHPFKPGMRFLAFHMNSELRHHPFLVQSSRDARNRIGQWDLDLNDHVLMEFDLKDYFTTGSHESMISCAKNTFPEAIRSMCSDLCQHILKTQYVDFALHDTPSFEDVSVVNRGSGMGLICSGELSDLVFTRICETRTVFDEKWCREHGVARYLRFRDDGLIAIKNNQQCIDSFKRAFQSCAGDYEVKFSEPSREARFLDLHVQFVNNGIKIGIGEKANHVGIPLSHTSCHTPTIHKNWPIERCKHFAAVCTNGDEYRKAFSKLCSSLNLHAPGHPSMVGLAKFRRPSSLHSTIPRQPFKGTWLKLRYHPWLASMSFNTVPARSLSEFLRTILVPRISWKLAAQHLMQTFKINMKTLANNGWRMGPDGRINQN